MEFCYCIKKPINIQTTAQGSNWEKLSRGNHNDTEKKNVFYLQIKI